MRSGLPAWTLQQWSFLPVACYVPSRTKRGRNLIPSPIKGEGAPFRTTRGCTKETATVITPKVKKRLRRRGAIALVVVAVLVVIDALALEPFWIEVTHHQVPSPFVAPLKIAHLTDLHTQGVGRRELSMFALLEQEDPDVIVITGDVVTGGTTEADCRAVLGLLHAPLGVWLVEGNWEHRKGPQGAKDLYESAGVYLLDNQSVELRPGLWLVGFDDAMTGSPKIETAMLGIPDDAYIIALFHSPEFFDRIAAECDLALAGHTHGGQVRLPWLPPVWLPPGSGRFVEGWYEREGSQMYVCRGIGMSILPVRFFCRPELAVITVGERSNGR